MARIDELSRAGDVVHLLFELDPGAAEHRAAELARLELAQDSRGGAVRYLVARGEGGVPVGLLPFYSACFPYDTAVMPPTLFESTAPPRDGEPFGLVGSPGGVVNQLVIAAHVDEQDATRTSRDLVDHAGRSDISPPGRFLLIPNLTGKQAVRLGGRVADAAGVERKQQAVLPVVWSSFDDYISWLPPQRRGVVRRERRKFLGAPITVREELVIDMADELAPLLAQTERHHGRDVSVEQMEFYLVSIALHHGDGCVAFVAYRYGRPVAFSLVLGRGKEWDMRAWGCDYDVPREERLYFNMAFYEPITRAIDRGVELLDFGTGSLEAKVLRGCETRELRTVLIDRRHVSAGIGNRG
ncbi:GNAT family N-acetyltransferase [Saccharothrix xinjiangensis]|uniref:GNAT family N-acetyltransferase n=1 Tax=Saccharothrix xinjiangensis TaxID=204798 RepID=UPI0031D3468F